MPILTKTEFKNITGISVSNWDTQIDTLIPAIQDMVVKDCNNSFLNQQVSIAASTLSFDTNTITDSESGFVTAFFVNGEYEIRSSKLNDRIVTVTEVEAGALTVSETLLTEAAKNEISITKVEFPERIKPLIAELIKIYLKNEDDKDIWNKIKTRYGKPFK